MLISEKDMYSFHDNLLNYKSKNTVQEIIPLEVKILEFCQKGAFLLIKFKISKQNTIFSSGLRW